MPRTSAGHRYPHVSSTARPHDHAMCAVVGKIAERAAAGTEPWGTPHAMPPLADAAQAHAIRNKLFNARKCAKLARIHGPLSVSVRYATDAGEHTNTRTATERGYVLVVAVYTREQGRKAIIDRVNSGAPLSYNIFKEPT